MMRLLSILSVSLLASQALAGDNAARVISLEEALQTARAKQPQLSQARAATASARARADEAWAPLLPQLTGTASYQRTTGNFVPRAGSGLNSTTSSNSNTFDTYNSFNFGLSVNQLVWDFGVTYGRWNAAKANASAQEESERSTLLQALLNVRSAFFDARAAKEMIKVAQDTLDNQDKHLGQIQGFVEVGTRPEIDLAQVRTDRANAQVQLINAANAYETAKARLNQAMGVESPTDYDVADEAFPPVDGEDEAIDPLLREALKARPEIGALADQAQAQQLTLDSVKGAYWPSLGISSGLTTAGMQIDSMAWNWNIGATLTWQLFQGTLTLAQANEARSNLDNARAQLEVERNQIRLEVDQARLGVRAAKAALSASDEAVANARVRLQLAEGRYQTGVGNIIELGDAQVALTGAEGQRVQADFNLATARASLLKALGRL